MSKSGRQNYRRSYSPAPVYRPRQVFKNAQDKFAVCHGPCRNKMPIVELSEAGYCIDCEEILIEEETMVA